MKKICPNCGHECNISEFDIHCSNCGWIFTELIDLSKKNLNDIGKRRSTENIDMD